MEAVSLPFGLYLAGREAGARDGPRIPYRMHHEPIISERKRKRSRFFSLDLFGSIIRHLVGGHIVDVVRSTGRIRVGGSGIKGGVIQS